MPNNSRTITPAPSNNNEHYFRWTHTLTLKLIDILGQHYERNQEYTLLKLYQGGKKGSMKKVEVAKIITDKFNDDDPKPTHQKVMTKIKEENEENRVPEATIASRLQAGLARLYRESNDCDDGSEEEDAGDSIFGDELGSQSS
ncbi:hypothetical protein BDA99DRAFT_610405 [Phascolomyces articulosus]|uniref:Uncharacterized protein n=1 Tax=Phascolomyces articulosus TaxID=60185 RepID=A0AAD5JW75_9FUNG|nr:hypothetical protein BDA99DRAFT_610405 [Phascolomyces articulosus]